MIPSLSGYRLIFLECGIVLKVRIMEVYKEAIYTIDKRPWILKAPSEIRSIKMDVFGRCIRSVRTYILTNLCGCI